MTLITCDAVASQAPATTERESGEARGSSTRSGARAHAAGRERAHLSSRKAARAREDPSVARPEIARIKPHAPAYARPVPHFRNESASSAGVGTLGARKRRFRWATTGGAASWTTSGAFASAGGCGCTEEAACGGAPSILYSSPLGDVNPLRRSWATNKTVTDTAPVTSIALRIGRRSTYRSRPCERARSAAHRRHRTGVTAPRSHTASAGLTRTSRSRFLLLVP